jgi:long-subunit fatty acid transport protein
MRRINGIGVSQAIKGFKIPLAFIAVLSVLTAGMAKADSNLSWGSDAAQWLNLSQSARVEALGEAYVGVADDVDTLGVNPAGLAQLANNQVYLAHNSWIQGILQEQGTVGLSLGSGHLGLGLTYLNFGSVDQYTLVNGAPVPGGSYQPSVWGLEAGYGLPLTNEFKVGVGLKGFLEDLALDNTLGIGADLGGLWTPENTNINVGLAVLNIGGDGSFSLPAEIRAGMAWQNSWAGAAGQPVQGKLLLSLDGMAPLSGLSGGRVAIGGEYWYMDVVGIRAGQQLVDNGGLSGLSGLSGGLGLKVAGMELDYALTTRGDLGNANLFTLLAGI